MPNDGARRARQASRSRRAVTGLLAVPVALVASCAAAGTASASRAVGGSYLSGLTSVKTLASTTPANGDENPYSVDVSPVSAGRLRKGDVLVDNFNARSNKQGTGSTIVEVSPAGKVTLVASIPRHLAGCPGGVGLTTAFTVLRLGGWMIVGSTPSTGGTTATAGAGCLIELNASGKVVGTISGPGIDGPWDMATVDDGATATLLVTNTLAEVKAPGQAVVDRGTLLRVRLALSASAPPKVTSKTVVASGLPEQASLSAFVRGPTGVAVIGSTAYVASPLQDAIVSVPDATTRSTLDKAPAKVASGGYLRQPLAMVATPDGDLITTNGLDGDVVEVSTSGKQLREFAVDPDPAQSPPGSGDLFGLALAQSGRAVYFAKDDTNTLAELS